jgi:hypothetical protein
MQDLQARSLFMGPGLEASSYAKELLRMAMWNTLIRRGNRGPVPAARVTEVVPINIRENTV